MSSLFPELREELIGAMERGPRRRDRRKPAAIGVAVAVAVAAAVFAMSGRPHVRPPRPAVTAAPTATPALPPAIEHAIRIGGTLAPGTPVIQLRAADDTGLEWDAAMWAGTDSGISITQAPSDAAANQIWGAGGWGTFAIAYQLLASPLGGLQLTAGEKDGRPHYVVVGIAESRATGVVVSLDGERRAAVVSNALLTRPVVVPGRLSPAGRRTAAALPREVTLKLFAAAFSPRHPPSTQTLRPRIEITRPDGTWSREYGPRFCVSRRCGQPPMRLR